MSQLTHISTEELKLKANALQERISVLRNTPSTRMSAMGGFIQEAHVIREWENKDAELGPILAELEKRKNTDGEKLFFICYDTKFTHVVPFVTENGVLKSGGLLENYFVGRMASEHAMYVSGRHGKVSTEVKFSNVKFIEDSIDYTISLDGVEFDYSSKFRISVDQPDYFYIEFQNKKIKRTDGSERGPSKHQACMATYGAGFLYKKMFNPNKNLNIR